jgi:hypothetical protein
VRVHLGGSGDTERAPGHAELSLIDRGARVDLDLIIDSRHGRPKLECQPVAGRKEFPLYMEVAVIDVGDLT